MFDNNLKTRGRPVLTAFERFSDYAESEVLLAISELSAKDQELLKKGYGEFFDDINYFKKLTVFEQTKIYGIFQKLNKILDYAHPDVSEETLEENKMSLENCNDDGHLTTSAANDLFYKVNFKRYSLKEELDFIKKTKLSYYDDVSDDSKELYIKYYGEVKPYFKERYEKATGDEKERILRKAIERSHKYRDEFIKNNLCLVLPVAKKYLGFDSLENLWQEGIIGMIKALENFDVERGCKFSTYAMWWIRSSINNYVYSKVPMVRVPKHLRQEIVKLENDKSALSQELGHEPTNKEVIKYLEIPQKELDKLNRLQLLFYERSLDEPFSEKDDDALGDFIPTDDFSKEIDYDIIISEFSDLLKKAKLSDREREILYMRFGFYDGVIYKLEQISKKFGVTRERVRQIEKEALEKLRCDGSIKRFINGDIINPGKIYQQKSFNGSIPLNPEGFRQARNLLINFDLNKLDAESRFILELHYGLNNHIASASEIADILGISMEEVLYKEQMAFSLIRLYLSEETIKKDNVKTKKLHK